MNLSDAYNVYRNIAKMFSHRGLNISGRLDDMDALSQKLSHKEFVILEATGQSVKLAVCLIAPGSEYASRLPEFKKLWRSLPKPSGAQGLLNIMFVSAEPLSNSITKMLEAEYPSFLPGGEGAPAVYVEHCEYGMFVMEIPAHSGVPEHVIVSQEDVDKFCDDYYTSPAYFPKILATDPMAVWIGARPGMVVQIRGHSENTGLRVSYRQCIPNVVIKK